MRYNPSFLRVMSPYRATMTPVPSELAGGCPYPRTRPLLLDHDVSSPVVLVNGIAVSFVDVFLLIVRRPHRPRHHRYHRPPKTWVKSGNRMAK